MRMASGVRSGNPVSTNARIADVGKWRTRKTERDAFFYSSPGSMALSKDENNRER
jgi:hypothetical protein